MENAKEIWELINAGGFFLDTGYYYNMFAIPLAKILIAGSSGEMPKQVVSAIKQS